jgi:hypothetical protein
MVFEKSYLWRPVEFAKELENKYLMAFNLREFNNNGIFLLLIQHD